ncbi:MAG: DUF2478 domain-containing protein [Betaproteobacteria bacterium]|nr:DUF2478 domain-containing protein [Betaproteobacteria bacterium]
MNENFEIYGFHVAAIVHSEHGVADNLLADFAFGLRRDGWRVQGLVQQEIGGHGKAATMLVDLENGMRYPLFQDLGPGSTSCSLDQSSLAAASIALREALVQQPDLAVANRFGAVEAEGKGLMTEMLALIADGIPLITSVASDYLMDWRMFCGNAGVELPPEIDALRNWFAGIQSRERSP